MRGLLTSLLLIGSAASAGSVQLPPQYARNLERPVHEQVCRAARALERSQGSYLGPQGRSEATWEWTPGSGRAADNTAGVVALALAQSAERCGATRALERYAASRAARHTSWELLYDADVETLAVASSLGDRRLRDIALDAFDRRYEGATGDEIVARWFMVRPQRSLIGFDAALAIRAGLSVGRAEKAREIADAVLAAAPRWAEGEDTHGYLTISRGALLEALAMVDRARYARASVDLMHHLALTQARDGSWGGRNTQATAYAVRGLARWGEDYARQSAERGRKWLRLTQLGGGAWASYNDLLPEPFVGEAVPEVTAEVLLALLH